MQHAYLFLECFRKNTENAHATFETTHKNAITFANTISPNKMSRRRTCLPTGRLNSVVPSNLLLVSLCFFGFPPHSAHGRWYYSEPSHGKESLKKWQCAPTRRHSTVLQQNLTMLFVLTLAVLCSRLKEPIKSWNAHRFVITM